MTTRLFLCLVLFCRLSIASAQATPPPAAPPPATSAQTQAAQWYQKAMAAAQANKVGQMVDCFQKAVSLAPANFTYITMWVKLLTVESLFVPPKTLVPQFARTEAFLQNEIKTFPKPGDQKRLQMVLGDIHYQWAENLKDSDHLDEAITQYQAALAIDRKLRPQNVVHDLNSLGKTCEDHANAYNDLSQYAKAVEFYRQALPIRREIKDRTGEAATLNNLGFAYINLSQYAKAIECFREALPIDRELKDKGAEATTLNNLGLAYDNLSQYVKALPYYQQALHIMQKVNDRTSEAGILINLGGASIHLSQYDKAIEFYEQTLPIQREAKDRSGEATTLSNLGLAYDSLSQYAKAIECYQQALPIRREVKDRKGEATTLNNLGAAYDNLSQYAKAIDFLQQALFIEREVKDRAEEASTLNNLGEAYNALSQYVKAIGFLQQALPIRREVKDRKGEASTLNNLGAAYDNLSQYAKAIDFLQQALFIEREVKDRAEEASTLNNLGEAYNALSQYVKAIGFLQQALPITREVKDRAGEAITLNNLMDNWKSLGKLGMAIFYGKQSVNVYQSIRGDIRALDQQTQKTYLASQEHTYRYLAELLISQGRLPEAEQVLALLKDQELSDFVQRDAAALPPPQATIVYETAEQTQKDRYQALSDPITALGEQIDALQRNPERTPAQDTQLAAYRDQIGPAQALFNAFLTSLPQELADAADDTKKRAQQIQEAEGPLQTTLADLGPGTVALFTLVEPDRYRVVVVTSQTEKAEEFKIKAEDLRAKVLAWRQALKDPHADPRPLGEELYRILIGPIEKDLAGAKAQTVMWSLDDLLRYIPIAALYDGKHYLIERYRTSVFTGASVPGLAQSDKAWTVLALGVSQAHTIADTTGGSPLQFPALPDVPQELHGIVRDADHPTGVLSGTVLLDDQFTPQALKIGLTHGNAVVHIASHFTFGKDYKSSYLLLGGAADAGGDRLTLDQLSGMGQVFQHVDLLTLSACETALSGQGGDGHEIESFGALAQQKGAASILASLWPVADASTQVLMDSFYRTHQSQRGISKSEALRQAQLSLLHGGGALPMGEVPQRGTQNMSAASGRQSLPPFAADPKVPYAHPFYWAPFILIGNWR